MDGQDSENKSRKLKVKHNGSLKYLHLPYTFWVNEQATNAVWSTVIKKFNNWRNAYAWSASWLIEIEEAPYYSCRQTKLWFWDV